MIINGENTLISDPDRAHCQHALESLDHLVVIDIFLTETAELADVVFPATAFAETDGVCVNTERRVQRLRAAVPPPGEAKPDWWIVSRIARRMGIPGFDFASARDVFDELCSLSPIYAGLDWDRIERNEYQWPVPHRDHPGTPILHQEEFPNGRGIFSKVDYRDPAESVSAEFPVWLTTGRRLPAYHTRTQTGRARGIDYLLSEESLEVHPDDVAAWGSDRGGLVPPDQRQGPGRHQGARDGPVAAGNGVHELRLQRGAGERADRIRVRPGDPHRGAQGLPGARRAAGGPRSRYRFLSAGSAGLSHEPRSIRNQARSDSDQSG